MENRGSYPHPIIDPADDVGSEFDVVNVGISPSHHDIEVTYEIRTSDPDLVGLLQSGDARHSLRWRCSSTLSTGEMEPEEYQRNSGCMKLRAWLDQDLVKGDVVSEVRVIVAKDISDFSWKRQHADYDGATFDLQAGDILAEGGTIIFNAQKLYDPLDPPIGSCFKIVRSTSRRKGMAVIYGGDETIDVQLPAKTFDNFKLFSNKPELQIGLVILPALMESLEFMKANRDEEPLDDKAWFITLDRMVKEQGGGWDKSTLELAQKILGGPVDNAFHLAMIAEDDD